MNSKVTDANDLCNVVEVSVRNSDVINDVFKYESG